MATAEIKSLKNEALLNKSFTPNSYRMKIKIFVIISFLNTFVYITCFAQDFSIGWANLGTRFSPNKQNYEHSNHDFLSPGFELQLSYKFSEKLVVTSGVNYQSLFLKTPVENKTYPPSRINSLLVRDLSIPILLRYKFEEIGSFCHLDFISGIYFAFPQFAQETINDKIYGSGGYRAREITEYLPPNYSFIYAGVGTYKTISPRFEIYAEPFGCYQLKKNRDDSLATQVFRNRFWFGIKLGINYLFEIKKNEN